MLPKKAYPPINFLNSELWTLGMSGMNRRRTLSNRCSPLLLVIGFGESYWNYGYGKVSYGRKAFNYLTSGKCSKSKSLISYVSLLLLLNSYAYRYCRCRSDHRHRSRQVPLMFELISDLAFSRASFF